MRRLVIGLIVLIGLLVALDFGAAALAESTVSRQMREQIGLADDPSVRINGFPFLTQAISGNYGSVDVDATRITVGELKNLTVHAQLRDVDAPLSMLLGSGPKSLQVGEAEGTVRIGAADLENLLPGISDLRIESLDEKALEQAADDSDDAAIAQLDPDSSVRLVGTTKALLGQQTEVSVIATLKLDGGRAQIVPNDIRLGGGDGMSVPGPVQAALRERFTVTIDPGRLPLQVTPTKLQAKDGTLEISGTATDLTLGATPPTAGG